MATLRVRPSPRDATSPAMDLFRFLLLDDEDPTRVFEDVAEVEVEGVEGAARDEYWRFHKSAVTVA